MSLSCECYYEPESGDILWNWPEDYSVRFRKCCSCGEKINIGEIVAKFERWKVPESYVEVNIYGEDYENGPPRASYYHCERCADIMFSLLELGFCFNIKDNMFELAREYAEMRNIK